MGDVERRAPVAPLLAYTASKQKDLKNRRGKSKTINRVKPGVSKVYKTSSTFVNSRPRNYKAEKKIDFDESARREYLTGFQKRKQARIDKGREKARERSKLEMKQMRVEMREARKKQAAENVAAEKQAYGDADGGSKDNDDDDFVNGTDEDDEEEEGIPSAFDTEQHHTTITVQEFDPNEPEKEFEEKVPKRKVVKESLPPSSRRIAKKLKSSKELAGAREISKLMDNDENLLDVDEGLLDAKESEKAANSHNKGNSRPFSKVRKAKFRYESKLDRAKAKSQAKETKAKWAEKRREERNASGPKGRMQKNKGKRGVGGKGTKRK